MISQST